MQPWCGNAKLQWGTWGTGCAARDARHPTNLTTEVGPEQRQHEANPQTSGPQQGGNTSRMGKWMHGCATNHMNACMRENKPLFM